MIFIVYNYHIYIYFSCYNLNQPPSTKRKIPQNLDCQIFNVIIVLGHSNFGVLYVQMEKSNIFNFYTCNPEKVSMYHTGSAFTQQYYVCQV